MLAAPDRKSRFLGCGDIDVSFEFFPPKTAVMEETLWRAIRRLEPLHPNFISVTYGAGGSTRERTHATIERVLKETELKPAAHLTCVEATKPEIDETNRNQLEETSKTQVRYVPKLRMYPHALRDANAFYSPQKKAILFGYFAAKPADITLQMPGNLTFTCLSHDIIAHETTHAILDGLHRRYTEDTNPDVLAFHEAFADIIALFQHFTFPHVLKNQIAATRGNLAEQNLLGKLAQEFGIAIGNYSALRDAIGTFNKRTKEWKPIEPTGEEYRTIMEPHARGSILVSAVFEAFMNIYKNRVADLLRIATGGTGVLQQGELPTDLVNRLASEAAKASRHVLSMCIRALDFCPPVDINFGDFLRAIITADMEMVQDDDHEYRLAFIDAFRKRGIYPTGIKHLSVESLSYPVLDIKDLEQYFTGLVRYLRKYRNEIIDSRTRKEIFAINKKYVVGQFDTKTFILDGLHSRLSGKFEGNIGFEKLSGMMFSRGSKPLGILMSESYKGGWPSFWVNTLHLASRVGPNGNQSNQIIVSLTQKAHVQIVEDRKGGLLIKPDEKGKGFTFNGGCTLIFDLDTLDLKYAISKPILDIDALSENIHRINRSRCLAIYKYQKGAMVDQSQFQAYFGMDRQNSFTEPFHFLHTLNQ
jgi:quinol monooxygenase YgiN